MRRKINIENRYYCNEIKADNLCPPLLIGYKFSLCHCVELFGKSRLLVCSRVLLVDTLACRAVDERAYGGEHLGCGSLIAGIYRRGELFDGRLYFRLDHLVLGSFLFDNQSTLLCGFYVGHV